MISESKSNPNFKNLYQESIGKHLVAIFQGNDNTAPIFWGGGAVAILTIIPMEHWDRFQLTYLIIAELFTLGATALRIFNSSWQPMWSRAVGIVVASLGISGLIWITKNFSMNLSVLFIWVALFAALNFTIKTLVYVIGLIGVEYATVLIASHSGAPIERWLEIIGTALVSGGTVSLLVAELRRNSLQDPLTKLPNRRAWTSRLEEQISQASRSSLPLSIAIIDLDQMKETNDNFGHIAGDQILKTIGSVWPSLLRSGSQLARIGGDEFSIIAPDTDVIGLEAAILRMKNATPEITFSVGIATWDGAESIEHLVSRADKLMYKMKIEKSHPITNEG